jgi:amidase
MADEIRIDNSHGRPGFDQDAPPVVRVTAGAGDRIALETSDEAYRQMDERRDLGAVTATINPVTGPVYVEGAEPGDALAVTVHEIRLIEHGWSIYLPGVGALARRMGPEMFVRKVPLDGAGVHLTDRITVPAAPMLGCVGVAPSGAAASTVMPSYPTGGNMDLTDARPGSTVYLPVQVPGALLSVGDIHAVMARGESSFVAIEAQGTAVVGVDVVKGLGLRAPRIDTGDEIVFVGLGDPVQESIARGYEDAFAFLTEDNGWSAGDAYAVLSACAHSELGGPTGSVAPDPLHPMAPVGAVTLHRFPKSLL